jgi:hypothetical protein
MSLDLDSEMSNFNKVKDIVLNRLVEENLLNEDDAEEFSERCQVLVYKGKWFKNWFDKNMKIENKDENSYYIRIVELKEKEDEVDKLLRRTTGNYDE